MLRRFVSRYANTNITFSRPQHFKLQSRIGSRWISEYVRQDKPKTSVMLELKDRTGALHEILQFFAKHEVNMTHIESRPAKGNSFNYNFNVDFDGKPDDPNVTGLLADLRMYCTSMLVLNERLVPWFPKKISDLDMSVGQTLDAGADLESDHPGFKDTVYRDRRNVLATIAANYRQGQPIPHIEYTKDEVRTWGAVYNRMTDLWDKYACDEFKHIMPLLEQNCGYAADNIPQQEDISRFLKDCTGFTLRPVGGLLSARDFLNGLAFRVFFATQYIRHHSKPLYTPEPDICHELLGHAPMFADPDFADFSHEVGLASLGASDDDIKRLATCYWFSVEFGLTKQHGEIKAYGAGLLSSFGELEYACSPDGVPGGSHPRPEYREWDPYQAARQEYPITDYQPIYYVSESLSDAKSKMRDFCESMNKPFHARYCSYSQTVVVNRAVKVADKSMKQ